MTIQSHESDQIYGSASLQACEVLLRKIQHLRMHDVTDRSRDLVCRPPEVRGQWFRPYTPCKPNEYRIDIHAGPELWARVHGALTQNRIQGLNAFRIELVPHTAYLQYSPNGGQRWVNYALPSAEDAWAHQKQYDDMFALMLWFARAQDWSGK